MGQNPNRPLSPHLGIYQRSPAMMVSIIHRITGFILATAGMMTLLWWLSALSGGTESYANFLSYVYVAGKEGNNWQIASNWFFRLVALGVTYSFFQHLFSGLRHFVMDIGAGYELDSNRNWTWAVFVGAFLATALVALLVASRVMGV
jgi:succinate dehydrogenase / fumarate reductase, cytochrome b subunit